MSLILSGTVNCGGCGAKFRPSRADMTEAWPSDYRLCQPCFADDFQNMLALLPEPAPRLPPDTRRAALEHDCHPERQPLR